MNGVVKMAVLAMCLHLATGEVEGSVLSERSFRSLVQAMRTSAYAKTHGTRSSDCFQYYKGKQNTQLAKYEQKYSECLHNSDMAKEFINNSTQMQRQEIERMTQSSYQSFYDCINYIDSIPYFKCFDTAGNDNMKRDYNIAVNASAILIVVRENIRLIDNEQFKCTNASQRAYNEELSNIISDLQNCIMGLNPVPTEAAPPRSTATPPTEAPATTRNWYETTAPAMRSYPEEKLHPNLQEINLQKVDDLKVYLK